jgi:hypothetical protein
MTRQRRLEFVGKFCRSRFRRNRREMIFESDDDRRTFTDYNVIQCSYWV